jgi:hypothetical protein
MLKIEIALWESKDPAGDTWICDCFDLGVQKKGSTPRVAFMNVINALRRIKKYQLEELLRTHAD